MVDTLILGAGIAGLVFGVRSKQDGNNVVLLESSDRAGGALKTIEKDGFLLEIGPNTVQPNSELLNLIQDLSLDKEVVFSSPRIPRYIWFDDKLHPVPLSPPALLKSSLLTTSAKFRLFLEYFVPRKSAEQEETLASFSTRRFGHEVTERLLGPFVSGVWAGDVSTLSAQASFPKLTQAEETAGSVIKGFIKNRKKSALPNVPKGLLSFRKGLQSLPRALAQNLGEALHLKEKVLEIQWQGNNPSKKNWLVKTEKAVYESEQLALGIPAHQSAPALQSSLPEVARLLAEIPYVSLVVLHLRVKKSEVGHPLQGFGFLVGPDTHLPFLGCLWNSSLFPGRAPQDEHLLTVFMGGAKQPHWVNQSDEELLKAVQPHLQHILEIRSPLKLILASRYDKAIPQYTLGHAPRVQKLKRAETEYPGLMFIGNYMEGISVGDVVRQSFSKSS